MFIYLLDRPFGLKVYSDVGKKKVLTLIKAAKLFGFDWERFSAWLLMKWEKKQQPDTKSLDFLKETHGQFETKENVVLVFYLFIFLKRYSCSVVAIFRGRIVWTPDTPDDLKGRYLSRPYAQYTNECLD